MIHLKTIFIKQVSVLASDEQSVIFGHVSVAGIQGTDLCLWVDEVEDCEH